MTVLSVDTERYSHAALEAAAVGRSLRQAVESAALNMASADNMAGWDSAGVAWAESYDAAVRGLFRTAADLAEETEREIYTINLAGLRYVHTEYTASGGTSSLAHRWVSFATPVRLCPPSASGGIQTATPELWDLVANAAALVWPTADTAKLRETGGTWNHLADGFDAGAAGFSSVTRQVDGLHSQDIELLRERNSQCAGVCVQLGEAARDLGSVCSEFARQVDDAHWELAAETARFAAESMVIAGAGGLAALLTGGTLAPATAAVLTARLAVLGARLSSITARLSAASTALVQRLQPLAALTARLSGSLQRFSPAAVAVGRRLAPAVLVADKALKSTAFKLLVDGPAKAAGELMVKQVVTRLPTGGIVTAKFNVAEQAAHVIRHTTGVPGLVGRSAAAGAFVFNRADKLADLSRPGDTFWAQSGSDRGKPAVQAGTTRTSVAALRPTAAARASPGPHPTARSIPDR